MGKASHLHVACCMLHAELFTCGCNVHFCDRDGSISARDLHIRNACNRSLFLIVVVIVAVAAVHLFGVSSSLIRNPTLSRCQLSASPLPPSTSHAQPSSVQSSPPLFIDAASAMSFCILRAQEEARHVVLVDFCSGAFKDSPAKLSAPHRLQNHG